MLQVNTDFLSFELMNQNESNRKAVTLVAKEGMRQNFLPF